MHNILSYELKPTQNIGTNNRTQTRLYVSARNGDGSNKDDFIKDPYESPGDYLKRVMDGVLGLNNSSVDTSVEPIDGGYVYKIKGKLGFILTMFLMWLYMFAYPYNSYMYGFSYLSEGYLCHLQIYKKLCIFVSQCPPP